MRASVDVFFVVDVAVGVAEGAADEHGDAVADVAGDDGVGELGLAEVGEGGVDGVAEVDAGVDEGAVEVEDEEAGDGVEGHTAMVAVGSRADDFGKVTRLRHCSERSCGDYRGVWARRDCAR